MAKRVRLNGRTGPSPSSANAASPTSPAAANGKPRVVNFGPSISDDAAAADAGRLAPVSFTSQDEEPQKRKLGPGRGKVAARAEADRLQAGRRSLPIYEGRQELLAAIRQFPTVIVVGETGSGKTTQLPQYLMEERLAGSLGICCTQPRRVAAISVARRVSLEAGCDLGQQVGYTVRFDDCSTPKTRLKYMTDGMLLREAMSSPLLERYGIVMLDEAHERTLHTDILFALIKDIQKRRKDKGGLRIVIMSATLQAERFASYFDDAPILFIYGRQYPVQIMYTAEPQADYVDATIVTVLQLHQEQPPGDVLVFLTGQEEIGAVLKLLQNAAVGLSEDAQELLVVPLYASLPYHQQLRVFDATPPGTRKVILATNVAETSITISGVKYVVDTGMVKQRTYNPATGMDFLAVCPVSKAQCTVLNPRFYFHTKWPNELQKARQRAGRAGRESSGTCFRLFTEDGFDDLQEHTVPEIQRCSLATAVLQLIVLGIRDVAHFDFMDPPSQEAITAALSLLFDLDALGEDFLPTATGRKMAQFPLEPKLAKVMLTAETYGCTEEVISIVALLSQESVFFAPRQGQESAAAKAKKKFLAVEGDHTTLLNAYSAFEKMQGAEQWCRENFINRRAMMVVRDTRKQLRGLCKRLGIALKSCGEDTEPYRRCFLSGMFTNVALQQPDRSFKAVESGISVHIHPSSALFMRDAKCVLYTELVQTNKRYMRNCCELAESWLQETAPEYFQ